MEGDGGGGGRRRGGMARVSSNNHPSTVPKRANKSTDIYQHMANV